MDSEILQIGVSYENATDLLVLETLLRRAASPESFEIVRSLACRTGVIGSVPLHTTLFYNQDNVDLAIFITDQDISRAKDDRLSAIIKGIESVNPVHALSSSVGVCNPHIEQWLIADHNAVKATFGLDSEKAIPTADSPKKVVELSRETQTTQLSKHDSYEALANTLDFEIVKKACPDFSAFCKELEQKSKGVFVF